MAVRMKLAILSRLACTLLCLLAGPLAAQAPRPSVGPNIRVSMDALAVVEPILAVNPEDSNHLVGAAMAVDARGRCVVTTYTSFDGGLLWHAHAPFEQQQSQGADPQVAFTPAGHVLFAAMGSDDGQGANAATLQVYRSTDGGRRFSAPTIIDRPYDHPQLAVDRNGGRIYLGGMLLVVEDREQRRGRYTIDLLYSDDDGRTFETNPTVVDGRGEHGVNVLSVAVGQHGRLYLFYTEFAYRPEDQQTSDRNRLLLISSSDRGKTWTSPVLVGTQRFGLPEERSSSPLHLGNGTTPMLIAIPGSRAQPDRLIAVWNGLSDGSHSPDDDRWHVQLSHSIDGGETWSAATSVADAGGHQLLPAIAHDASGRVALSWLDTRGREDRYDLMLAVSPDGLKQFSEPIRVSSQSSRPASAANLLPFAQAITSPRGTFLFTRSTFARYRIGGDYAGLVIDQTGVVHPFWPDAREGGFQIYTSRVNLDPQPALDTPTTRASVDDRVELRFEPVTFDAAASRMSLRFRLVNRSDAPIFAPVLLTVEDLRDQSRTSAASAEEIDSIRLLGAENGQQGVGAVFDVSAALGPSGELTPSAVSEEIQWQIEVTSRLPELMIQMTIEAGTPSEEP